MKFKLANSSCYSASKEDVDKDESNGKSQPALSYNLILKLILCPKPEVLQQEAKLKADFILTSSNKNNTEDTTARTSRTENKNSR